MLNIALKKTELGSLDAYIPIIIEHKHDCEDDGAAVVFHVPIVDAYSNVEQYTESRKGQ